MLVEFADHMTLIEAPQNDDRALAVIAKAREVKPDKPLTQVVEQPPPFRSFGRHPRGGFGGPDGHRAQGQRAVLSGLCDARPHTIVPDALAKNPKPLKIETVDEELELKDATRTVNLYRIAGSPHADTLLMAYFPKERILVEGDVYTPGAALTPYAPNLMENITKRKLRVDRIVPLHGMIGPYGDLVKVVQAAKPAAN